VYCELVDPIENNSFVAEIKGANSRQNFNDIINSHKQGECFHTEDESFVVAIQTCEKMNIPIHSIDTSFQIEVKTNDKEMIIHLLNRFVEKTKNINLLFRQKNNVIISYSSEPLPTGKFAIVFANKIFDRNLCFQNKNIINIFFTWEKNDVYYAYVLINNM
jgi:hypothetical protein